MHRIALTILASIVTISGCVTRPQPQSPVESRPIVEYWPASWATIQGWHHDNLQESWEAFLSSCKVLNTQPTWIEVCTAAKAQTAVTEASARQFFETHFIPYLIVEIDSFSRKQLRDAGLITGYYEPLLRGSRTRSSAFSFPLYAPPDDLLTIDLSAVYPELKGKRLRGRLEGKKVVPYSSRAELARNGALVGKELVWVDSAVDAFFLQIQGSGRVELSSGETIRLGYADQNGHPYRAIGRYLVDKGELTLERATAPGIRQWLRTHPERIEEVLNSNPSVVFFRENKISDPRIGPKGALGVALTPSRSIAVDPQFVPLGAPVFLATTQPDSATHLQRLVIAQDTGGAIRGAPRADYFCGFGAAAGELAGTMREQGRMWLLWPKGQPLPDRTGSAGNAE